MCSECGVQFEGRPNKLTCSRGCVDRRYDRLHPLKAKEAAARKHRRRRERRKIEMANEEVEPNEPTVIRS